MKEALIVFVKKPVEGKVKTRLAKGVGHAEAVRIYNKLLSKTEKVIAPLSQDVFIFSDVKFKGYFEDYPWHLQEGVNLGVKMYNAFEAVFALGYDKVSIIGSDCFELTTEIIQEVYRNPKEAVIGPSADGGYYLLALKRNHLSIFDKIDWSTEKVFEQTKKQLQSVEMNYDLLLTLTDIDDLEDLKLFPELSI
jgi:rSAM/selenodomain-associated transferase 1